MKGLPRHEPEQPLDQSHETSDRNERSDPMKNELLEEVWRTRDEFAKKCNYDIDAMVAALQEMERHPHSRLVDRRKGALDKDTGAPTVQRYKD